MNHEPGMRKITRGGEPWAHCILVDEQLIVIPAQTRAESPVPCSNQILDVRRLLQIGPAAIGWSIPREAESRWRSGVEEGGICDHIAKAFIEKKIIELHSCLEFVSPMVDG